MLAMTASRSVGAAVGVVEWVVGRLAIVGFRWVLLFVLPMHIGVIQLRFAVKNRCIMLLVISGTRSLGVLFPAAQTAAKPAIRKSSRWAGVPILARNQASASAGDANAWWRQ